LISGAYVTSSYTYVTSSYTYVTTSYTYVSVHLLCRVTIEGTLISGEGTYKDTYTDTYRDI